MVVSKNKLTYQESPIDALFQLMADCAPVLLWISRSDSLCIFFNKTWLEFTGKTLAEEWGVGWSEGIYFEDFQKAMDTYQQHFNEKRPFEMVYRLRRHDGEYRWILDKGVPYYGVDGDFQGFIGSCIDVTETKNAAELLQKSNEELEKKVQRRTAELQQSESALRELSRQQVQFVSTVSHDLRTPMTAIKSSLELMIHGVKGDVPSSMKPLLDMAYRNTERLLRLVNRILDVDKNKAGKLLLAKKTQLLLPLIQQALVSNQLYAEKYQVRLQLGDVLSDAKVFVDEDRLIQVLDNLLSNAAKFSRPHTQVVVSMQRRNGFICVLVKDCGLGISPEFAPKIFSKFMREKGASLESNPGTGLGLSIAKTIIEQHDGFLRFESSPEGTTFMIELLEVTSG